MHEYYHCKDHYQKCYWQGLCVKIPKIVAGSPETSLSKGQTKCQAIRTEMRKDIDTLACVYLHDVELNAAMNKDGQREDEIINSLQYREVINISIPTKYLARPHFIED